MVNHWYFRYTFLYTGWRFIRTNLLTIGHKKKLFLKIRFNCVNVSWTSITIDSFFGVWKKDTKLFTLNVNALICSQTWTTNTMAVSQNKGWKTKYFICFIPLHLEPVQLLAPDMFSGYSIYVNRHLSVRMIWIQVKFKSFVIMFLLCWGQCS